MKKSKYITLFACIAGLYAMAGPVAAAQDSQEKKSDAPQAAAAKEAGKPSAADAKTDPKSYIIGPEDVLRVAVWREPELSGDFPVRPDGKISLQLIGELQAAGVTPEQLGKNITEGLSKYMTRPEVSVAVRQVNSKKYFISGEIQRPGSYPLLNPTTVLSALVNAGGFRDFANTKKIVILRGTDRFYFNYKDVIKGKKLEQNIYLENGDQIIVP